MISDKQHFIFVHIPKTGGTSIAKALLHVARPNSKVHDHVPYRVFEPWRRIDTKELICGRNLNVLGKKLVRKVSEERIGASSFPKYLSFAFVRNPWARVVSWYRNVMRSNTHQRRLGIPSECSLREFLENHGEQWALRPQLFWLMDADGNIGVSEIGRFESLEADFDRICQLIGIETPSLGHALYTGSYDYREIYDSWSRQWVADRYAKEIEIFEYSFNQP